MLTADKFSQAIDELKVADPNISYISIIREYCDNNDIEYEIVPKLLTENLRKKLETESATLNLVDIPKPTNVHVIRF